MDKSSSQQLVTAQNFTIIESYKQITTSGKIPNSGFLQIIFVVGAERYHIIFDTVRGIIQPFFLWSGSKLQFLYKTREFLLSGSAFILTHIPLAFPTRIVNVFFRAIIPVA